MSDFSKDCTKCGAFVDVCPFMSEFGTPKKILLQQQESVFNCTSYRRCEAVLPLNISPADIFFETKEKLVEPPRQTIPSPVKWINRLTLATYAKLRKPKFLILFVIVLLIAAGIYLNQQGILSADVLKNLLTRHPVGAPVIFLFIYAIAPALFLPSIPITLAAGFFWGPFWGVVFSMIGATIGACLPFFLSRYLLQDFIKAKISPERWHWLQNKVNQHGWKAVAFTRLIPVFPFNLLNYLFGLTPIAFAQYLWSSFVFMLPACIAFVAFGSSLSELIMRGNIKGVIIGIVIAVVAFLIPLALRPFFRKIGDNKAFAVDETSSKNNYE